MCIPGCRDPRPQQPGVARDVWNYLRHRSIPAGAVQNWLHDWGVGRFADLCFSHADAVLTGVKKGILADDIAAMAP